MGARRRARAQAGHVARGHPDQVIRGQVDAVRPFVHVPLEGGFQGHDARRDRPDLVAGGGRQVVPGAPQVAPPVLEQPAFLALHLGCVRRPGVGGDRGGHVIAQRQRAPPGGHALVGRMGGRAHLRVRMDSDHEGAPPVRRPQVAERAVESADDTLEGRPIGFGRGARRGDLRIPPPQARPRRSPRRVPGSPGGGRRRRSGQSSTRPGLITSDIIAPVRRRRAAGRRLWRSAHGRGLVARAPARRPARTRDDPRRRARRGRR